MSLKRVCDFCGTDFVWTNKKYYDTRPDGMYDKKGSNKDIDRDNEFRAPSVHNSYTLHVQFTMLPHPSIEMDVCPDCCLQRLIVYVEKMAKGTVTIN